MATKIKGGGARKYDRNRAWCKAYRGAERAERSKALRILDHLDVAPWDGCARAAFERLPASVRRGLALPPLAKSPAKIRAEKGITLTQMKRVGSLAAAA